MLMLVGLAAGAYQKKVYMAGHDKTQPKEHQLILDPSTRRIMVKDKTIKDGDIAPWKDLKRKLNKDKRKEQRNDYILIWGGRQALAFSLCWPSRLRRSGHAYVEYITDDMQVADSLWTSTDSLWTSTYSLQTSTDPLLTSADSLLTSADSLLTSTDALLTSTDSLLTSTDSLLTSTDPLLTSTDFY